MPPSPGRTRRSIPPSHVPAFPGSHSSAPHHECQGGKTKRPPDEEAEDHEGNPGWFSQLIELCNDRHSGGLAVNVNHIYMSDAVVIEPLAKLARHVGWTVIAQQPWPLQNLDLVQT